jgi:Domain of unknown function (DUF1707)
MNAAAFLEVLAVKHCSGHPARVKICREKEEAVMTVPEQREALPEQAEAVREQREATQAGLTRILASQADRDATAQRLQVAFAELRLDDDEFDRRIRLALTAKTMSDLAILTSDLPARAASTQFSADAGGKHGKFALAMKSSIRRAGKWPVPRVFTCVVYKGKGLLDLREAELTSPVTRIRAIAYKSHTEILLPPGIRLELSGPGVSASADPGGQANGPASQAEDLRGQASGEVAVNHVNGHDLAPDAPVVRIWGLAYKGTIEAITRR